LRWQASNVVVTRGGDDSLMAKKDAAESPHKIDAIDALVSGVGGYLRAQTPAPSYAMAVFG
jgi:phage terminase large subunit-like protein